MVSLQYLAALETHSSVMKSSQASWSVLLGGSFYEDVELLSTFFYAIIQNPASAEVPLCLCLSGSLAIRGVQHGVVRSAGICRRSV